MASDITRGRFTAVAGGFLRGTAGQQVNFDPEAPPLPPTHVVQTTCLLERPEIDKKVKVTYERRIDAACHFAIEQTNKLTFRPHVCEITQNFRKYSGDRITFN